MQRIIEIKQKLDNLKSKQSEIKGQLALLKEQHLALNSAKTETEQRIDIAKKAIEFLHLVQTSTQNKITDTFEKLVTNALKFITEKDYNFKVEFGRRGNAKELNFGIISEDLTELNDPIDSESGGLLNILSFTLRLALMELSRPKIEGLIILDETFKNLNRERLGRASEFLKIINEKLGRQIIMVTHQPEFVEQADNVIKIGE